MAKIHFKKNIAPIEIADGSNLMQALLAAGLPVASSCHGDGVCSKCRIQILLGAENLSKPTELEFGLKDRLRISADTRISCQTLVNGDITVDTSYW